MADSPGTRIERRRRERRAKILTVSAQRFAAEGPDAVRLDEIADEADIARGTLYSHFPTKNSLIAAIVRPAIEQAVLTFEELGSLSARRAVDGLLRAYVALWAGHRDALRVAHRMREAPLGELGPLHARMMTAVLRVFGGAAHARLLRTDDPVLASGILARLAVPLLEQCEQRSPDGALFVESMAGLLLRPRGRSG